MKPWAAAGWLARRPVSLMCRGEIAPINPQNPTPNYVQNDGQGPSGWIPSPTDLAGRETGLAVLAGTQPRQRARRGWQRRPPGYAPSARPRLRVVGDSWEPPAQLDSGRQLSLLIKDDANRVGISFGDDEHPQNMVVRTTAGKRDVRCPQAGL